MLRFEILEKRILNPQVKLMRVYAPLIAKRAKPGQFIIFRVDEKGERIPLTIADTNVEQGSVTIIFQEVGAGTKKLGELNVGDRVHDFVGPLGVASHLDQVKRALIIGGGLGCAIAYPQAKYLHDNGAHVDIIAGFRTQELVFFEKEMEEASKNLFMMTDDGSYGEKGLVTNKLKELLDSGNEYDVVIAIGPLVMMKFVCMTTKEYGVKTIVSMNPIMVDGTGMCGACRVTVAGETKFACVEGPDFDGHDVDFDEAIRRSNIYKDIEAKSLEKHSCRIMEGTVDA